MSVFYTIFRGFCLAGMVFFGVSTVLAGSPKVQETEDLVQVGKIAQEKRVPVLVMFSASHCSYCVVLENEILRPMLLSGDYTNKVVIRKVVMDSGGYIKDFDGKDILASDMSSRYNVSVTPTMLFLDSRGKELTKRIIGVQTLDFFGGEVDNAIDTSIKKLRAGTRVSLNQAAR